MEYDIKSRYFHPSELSSFEEFNEGDSFEDTNYKIWGSWPEPDNLPALPAEVVKSWSIAIL